MKQLLMLLMFLCSIGVSAQDVIVKKDGSTVVCRVVEVNASEIVYKKWTDLNGSNYVMNRADASAINYQSGKRENLGELTNLYAPNNQNNGVQMLNDKALLAIDAGTPNYAKKAKTLKTIGWIGGIALIGIGTAMVSNAENGSRPYPENYYVPGGICIAGGIAWTTVCLIKAHKYAAKADWLQTSSIWQNEIKLKNGSSLTARVDILKDQKINNQAIGVGLSYNF